MEEDTSKTQQLAPKCVVCGRDAVTVDRQEVAMCAKHAAIFVTMDHRKNLAQKGRVVR